MADHSIVRISDVQSDKPRFAAGTYVNGVGRSLLVDENGIAWWVSCDHGTIKRAEHTNDH